MPAPTTAKGRLAGELLATELRRLGRADLLHVLCFSDAAWRRAMAQSGCPAYAARLASPPAPPLAPDPRPRAPRGAPPRPPQLQPPPGRRSAARPCSPFVLRLSKDE